MCGILFTNDPSVEKSTFTEALGEMKHRGPDAPSCYFEKSHLKLGHNRLRIIDLNERSNQPFLSFDKKHIIIYNGEIYNYKELKNKFDLKLETESDTEVLLELYKKLGAKVLDHLNGMFSFIICDLSNSTFFAARDRLGVKPLYYKKTSEGISFSSEIAPLLTIFGSQPIDKIGLRQYKKLRTFFNGRSLYETISMFPAGHYMENNKIFKWWDLPETEEQPAPTNEELRELITSAVNYRRISDVSVGCYLSGGIDSSITSLLSNKPDTWIIGFPDNNEFEWARIVADKIESKHHEVVMSYEEFKETATFLIKSRREPLSVPNEVPLYKLTTAAKKLNTVILSGEGADELFFGYDKIFRWANSNSWDLKEFTNLYAYGSTEDLEIMEDILSPFNKYSSALLKTAAFFQKAHLHGLLRRLDNSSMRSSVEARVPFVDYRLIERMWGVPFNSRMKDGIVKSQLKESFEDILPKEIIDRKKVGFPVDLSKIFNSSSYDSWLDFNLEVLNISEE